MHRIVVIRAKLFRFRAIVGYTVHTTSRFGRVVRRVMDGGVDASDTMCVCVCVCVYVILRGRVEIIEQATEKIAQPLRRERLHPTSLSRLSST